MSDIELVVRIDEKLYKDIFSNAEIIIYKGMRSGKMLLATLLRAIRKGTPLPKGHGRLIDADKIQFENAEFDTYSDYSRAFDAIDQADTIVEADKDYKVEVITRGNCMMCNKALTEGLFFCKDCEDKIKAKSEGEK